MASDLLCHSLSHHRTASHTTSLLGATATPQIAVVMAMLVRLMGWAPAMAGLVVTVVMIPLSTLLGRGLARVRRAMMTQTDARVKLASEIITGACDC